MAHFVVRVGPDIPCAVHLRTNVAGGCNNVAMADRTSPLGCKAVPGRAKFVHQPEFECSGVLREVDIPSWRQRTSRRYVVHPVYTLNPATFVSTPTLYLLELKTNLPTSSWLSWHVAAQELQAAFSAAKRGKIPDTRLVSCIRRIDDALRLRHLRIHDVFRMLVRKRKHCCQNQYAAKMKSRPRTKVLETNRHITEKLVVREKLMAAELCL